MSGAAVSEIGKFEFRVCDDINLVFNWEKLVTVGKLSFGNLEVMIGEWGAAGERMMKEHAYMTMNPIPSSSYCNVAMQTLSHEQ